MRNSARAKVNHMPSSLSGLTLPDLLQTITQREQCETVEDLKDLVMKNA